MSGGAGAVPGAPFVRVTRRRGSFGLDERRRPDPRRVEAGLRGLLSRFFPDLCIIPAEPDIALASEVDGVMVVLSMRGHAAVLVVGRAPAPPGPSRLLLERCRALRIPCAAVATLQEGRAALRRFGFEPCRGPRVVSSRPEE